MKLILSLMAVAGLSGCVAYGGNPYGYGSGVYYDNAPVYSGGYYVDRGYYNGTYYGNGAYYNGGVYYAPNHPVYIQRRERDRDRDGIPNRVDRDRDGDGVPNRRDAYPDDARRR